MRGQLSEAPAPIERAAKAAADAKIAMSAAWATVAWLDGAGPRRRLSEDFRDAMQILTEELAEAGYLERYRASDGTLQLPSLEPRGLRTDSASGEREQA